MFELQPLAEAHRTGVIDIINYYIENTTAAFPETPVSYDIFNEFLAATQKYPAFAVVDEGGAVLGVGMLRPYIPMPTFDHCAEIAYFLSQDACGKGIGTELLERLLEAARAGGFTNILAKISSENPASVRFHQRHGFTECGVVKAACRKNGRLLDVVWMQRLI